MIEQLTRLFDHMAWANARVLESLRAAPAPPPSAMEAFAHVLGAEHVWLARIEGRTPEQAVWPALGIEACADLADANARAFHALLERSTEADLDRHVHYRNSAGAEFNTRLEDILLHVALHGMHHRGQAMRAVREAGAVPLATDYIAFVRGVAAATRDPG